MIGLEVINDAIDKLHDDVIKNNNGICSKQKDLIQTLVSIDLSNFVIQEFKE